jgi:hypothetical protein
MNLVGIILAFCFEIFIVKRLFVVFDNLIRYYHPKPKMSSPLINF